MANKKAGSRAAAGQAKARERARRKARVGGPSVPAAAYAPPVEDDGVERAEAVREPDASDVAADAPAPAPRPAPRAAREAPAPVRRERVAAAMTPTGSLKRELALIAVLTALIAAALAAMEATNLLGA